MTSPRACDVDETFSCTEGGTLAIGGPWFSSRNTGRFNNDTYLRIQGADIVLNDGLDCFFATYGGEIVGSDIGQCPTRSRDRRANGGNDQSLPHNLVASIVCNKGCV